MNPWFGCEFIPTLAQPGLFHSTFHDVQSARRTMATRLPRPRLNRVPSTLDAFRNPGFRLLWPANFFSYISRWMQMTFLAWVILQQTGSPFLVALVGFFGMFPLLAFGAFGGVLADRMNRHTLLLSTQILNLGSRSVHDGASGDRHVRLLALLHCRVRQRARLGIRYAIEAGGGPRPDR